MAEDKKAPSATKAAKKAFMKKAVKKMAMKGEKKEMGDKPMEGGAMGRFNFLGKK